MIVMSYRSSLHCDASGCAEGVAIASGSPIQEITLMNKARDAKWGRVHRGWFCPKCLPAIRAVFKQCGVPVEAATAKAG